jgi:Mlc titration factor MtfA (ptsG expression regulator)
MFSFLRSRTRLKKRPFPAEWLEILERNVPLYGRLTEADKEELRGHVQVFLEEKRFEGCNGLTMTDEVRLTIAAQACLLLLHRESGYYPALSSIVVYPDEYVAPWQEVDESGIVVEGEEQRSGEFVASGALVLSWRDVLMSGVDEEGAYNVVIHEFAHQIDEECGITGEDRETMPQVLEREFLRLQHAAAHRRQTLFDPYGAGSRAEFFAVVTETFFENPVGFRSRHTELYEDMCRLFRQDPAGWPGYVRAAEITD